MITALSTVLKEVTSRFFYHFVENHLFDTRRQVRCVQIKMYFSASTKYYISADLGGGGGRESFQAAKTEQ